METPSIVHLPVGSGVKAGWESLEDFNVLDGGLFSRWLNTQKCLEVSDGHSFESDGQRLSILHTSQNTIEFHLVNMLTIHMHALSSKHCLNSSLTNIVTYCLCAPALHVDLGLLLTSSIMFWLMMGRSSLTGSWRWFNFFALYSVNEKVKLTSPPQTTTDNKQQQ
jgi:hypothetical protein